MPWIRRHGLLAFAVLATLGAPPATAQDDEARLGRVIHTPWLGLRFIQDEREAELVQRENLITDVHLAARPFLIVLPTRGPDDIYQIAAWDDDSIFAVRRQTQIRRLNDMVTPPYFGPGTGMADTAASSGALTLNPEGHHYLRGLRLGPDPDRHVFYVSEVHRRYADNDWVELPIEAQEEPLYLVAYYDENGDDVIQHGEYEFLVLRFEEPEE